MTSIERAWIPIPTGGQCLHAQSSTRHVSPASHQLLGSWRPLVSGLSNSSTRRPYQPQKMLPGPEKPEVAAFFAVQVFQVFPERAEEERR